MKSIRVKIVLLLVVLMLAMGIGTGVVAFTVTSRGLQGVIDDTLPEAVNLAEKTVDGRINGQLSALEVLASNPQIKDASSPWAAKKELLAGEVKRGGWLKIGYANLQGQNFTNQSDTPVDVSQRDFFKTALQGKRAVSDPTISAIDGSVVVIFAVPITVDNKVTGVLIGSRNGNELSDIIQDIKFKSTGNAFMVNNQGVTVAHTNRDLVKNMDNNIENAKKDPAFTQLAGVVTKMANRETDMGDYTYNGVRKVIAYQPVEGTNWSIAIAVEYSDIFSELATSSTQLLILITVFILVGIGAGTIFANRLIKPINKIVALVKNTADFDLAYDKSFDHLLGKKDEIGAIARTISDMRKALRGMVTSLKESTGAITANGESLAAATNQSAASMEEVAHTVEEVAKGASEQAKEAQNGSMKLMELSNEIEVAVNKSNEILNAAASVEEANKSGEQSLVDLKGKFRTNTDITIKIGQKVNKLAEQSDSISAIINAIKSIADQTNMLSLNAAIEAARAGEAGKGFAVVADEIRKLSNETAASTKEIGDIIKKIQDDIAGTKSDMDTAEEIVRKSNEGLENTEEAVRLIAGAAAEAISRLHELNESIQNVNSAKNEVVAAIQEISAISEEAAASAEEVSASIEEQSATIEDIASTADGLKDIAAQLKATVDRFRL